MIASKKNCSKPKCLKHTVFIAILVSKAFNYISFNLYIVDSVRSLIESTTDEIEMCQELSNQTLLLSARDQKT